MISMKLLFKNGLIALTMGLVFFTYGQSSGEKISTMDFVQILGDQREETIYYYENNWKVHRENALKKGYIDSYQLLEVPKGEDLAFEIILITTYTNLEQYEQREDNFGTLIEAHGGRRLLNEKQPTQFRNILFSRDNVRYLFEGD